MGGGEQGPELAFAMAGSRESLLRRWLGMVIERSSMEELATRSLGQRMRDVELLLEAADRAGGGHGGQHASATVTRLYPR